MGAEPRDRPALGLCGKIRGYGDFVGVGGHGLACVTV